jgi:uncharacterized membrane protein (DUF2068 family)
MTLNWRRDFFARTFFARLRPTLFMPRGKKMAVWEDIVLRFIAVYKCLHGLFFIAVGVGLIKLKHHDIPQILNDWVIRPLRINPENKMVDWALDEASKMTPHKMTLVSYAAFFYALLFLIEGVGLFLRKHWAEYFVVIVTGSLLPFEIYAMFLKVEWWKAGVIFGNLLILSYLIHRLRLDFTNSHLRRDKNDDEPPTASNRTPVRAENPAGNGRGRAHNASLKWLGLSAALGLILAAALLTWTVYRR